MNKNYKTAIVLGATGLTGSTLLQQLLVDNRYTTIKVFTRKKTGIVHQKLQEIVCNFLELEKQEKMFTANEVFCCIGTIAKKTPHLETYRKIDVGIPVAAAKLCKKNNIQTLVIVSAMGANVRSSIFYNKTKGEMEQEVLAQNVEHVFLLRPSLILGKRNEFRLGEAILTVLLKIFNPLLIGSLEKYQAIYATDIAKTMIIVAQKGFYQKNSSPILLSNQIKKISQENF